MNIERIILIGFLGNYLINTVAAALVALVPASTSTSVVTPQYVTFIVLSAIIVLILTWWYMRRGMRGWMGGLYFGGISFVTAIVTAFITGVSGVLTQTGSLSQVWAVLPNFWPFIWNWSTLVLLGYWVIPAVFVGWWFSRGKMTSGGPAMRMNAMPPSQTM